ncbi:hypothetical protein [Streptomyces sp. NPDC010273]|uniref:hypothetical protein n=1 Tax=Streptomyces sp. NPDC010273 TaxID=3364829 RepID=UPI0036EBABCD
MNAHVTHCATPVQAPSATPSTSVRDPDSTLPQPGTRHAVRPQTLTTPAAPSPEPDPRHSTHAMSIRALDPVPVPDPDISSTGATPTRGATHTPPTHPQHPHPLTRTKESVTYPVAVRSR